MRVRLRGLAALVVGAALVVLSVAGPAGVETAHAASTGSISGTVLGAASPGQVLPNVSITLQSWSGGGSSSIQPDANGAYRFDNVGAGMWSVCVYNGNDNQWVKNRCLGGVRNLQNSEYGDGVSWFETTGTETLTGKNIVLPVGATVTGTVRGAGSPSVVLPGASVLLAETGQQSTEENYYGQSYSTTADANGNFTITGVDTGTYFLKYERGNAFPDDDSRSWARVWSGNVGTMASATSFSAVVGQSYTGKDALLPIGAKLATGIQWIDSEGASHTTYTGGMLENQATGETYYGSTDGFVSSLVIRDIPAGSYIAHFGPSYNTGGLVGEYWQNKTLLADATPLTFSLGATTTLPTIILSRSGTIAGHITANQVNGQWYNDIALRYTRVDLRDSQDRTIASTWTDNYGAYSFSGVRAGDYRLFVHDGPGGQGFQSGYSEWQLLDDGEQLTGVDIRLYPGPTISGTITATGAVADQLSAELWTTRSDSDEENLVATEWVDENGQYEFEGVYPGTYFVKFEGGQIDSNGWYESAFNDRWWNDKPVSSQAVPIVVGTSSITGINGQVNRLGSISGTLRSWDYGVATTNYDPYTNRVMAGNSVKLYSLTGSLLKTTVTDSTGGYHFYDLPAAQYRIVFDGGATAFSAAYGSNDADPLSGDPIQVGVMEHVDSVDDWALLRGSLSGRVTGPGGAPLQGITVTAVGSYNGDHSATTNANGEYTITDMDRDSVRVKFSDPAGGYVTQYWGGATSSTATEIDYFSFDSHTGYDAQLNLGASVAGRVTLANGAANAGQYVTLYSQFGPFSQSALTDSAGNYFFGGLPADSYVLAFEPEWGGDYTVRWYSSKATRYDADAVTLVPGEHRTAVNQVLPKGASITGKVTSAAGAVSGARVVAYFPETGDEYYATANSAGVYTLRGLPEGEMTLRFRPSPALSATLANTYWNGKSSLATANTITTALGQALTNYNAVLPAAATISGTVKGGNPVANRPGIDVTAYTLDGDYAGFATTNAAGNYSIGGLVAGSYRLEFFDPAGTYATQWWNNVTTQAGAQVIPLTAGQAATARNATLQRAATISGTVTTDGTPGAYLQVEAFTGADSTQSVAQGYTDSSGVYTIKGLSAGTYYVRFSDNGGDFATQWWNGSTTRAGATAVTLTTAQARTGVNADLGTGATIGGSIVNAAGDPVYSAHVVLTSVDGADVRYSYPEADGTFAASGLAAGSYTLKVEPNGPLYEPEWWNNAFTQATATAITVAAGASSLDHVIELGPRLAEFTTSPVPTITGTAMIGQTLTAETGIWTPGPVAFEYQWFKDGAALAGETTSQYELETADAGSRFTVQVTGTADAHKPTTRTSLQTPIVGGGVLTDVTAPTITGTPTVGQALTASIAPWGPAPVTLTYQWKRAGAAIAGATAATYTPVAADAGKSISVSVLGTKPGYGSAARSSGSVVVGSALTASPTPTISGTPTSGQTLTAVPGAWGPAPVTLAYQWQRDGVVVDGATASTYVLGSADIGTVVTVSVTGSKANYTSITRTSAGASVGDLITAAPVPTVTGSPTVGATLTTTPGTWAPDPVDLAFQWKRAGVAISGAISSTYLPTSADVGKAITVTVTGTRSGFTTIARTSLPLTVGNALTSSVPTIGGQALVGKTLTALAGTWGPAPVTLTYQWLRDGVPVAGKTAATYVLAPADAGSTLSVVVTGSKASYTPVARTSMSTGLVTGGVLAGAVPLIVGAPTVGVELSATPGVWTAGTTLSYQWRANGTPIPGATGSTYALTSADLGTSITVSVTGTRPGYDADLVKTSAAVVIGDALTVGSPEISGVGTVGQTLTANPGTWGPDPVQFAYQWKRGSAVIAGATAPTYKLVAADAGLVVSVVVTGTKSGFTPVSVAAPGVTPLRAITPAPTPTITGTPTEGQTLTLVPGTWGPAPVALALQWYRDGANAGVGTKYVLSAADVGATITASVTATKAGYSTVVATTAGATVLGALTASPVPVITGAPSSGSTLTASTGAWGPDPVTLAYQWKRAGVVVGSNSPTYDATAADVGKSITVTVTGSRAGYQTIARTSAAVLVNLPFASAPTPTISGTAYVGQTLTLTPGAWAPTGAVLAYQWYRDGVAVSGRTATTYLLTTADAGSAITATVRATKAGYTPQTSTSSPTAMIEGGVLVAPVPLVTGEPTVGATLTATPGSWTAGTALAYQWSLAGEPIVGEASATYIPAAGDAGGAVTVAVTGSKPGFATVTKTSAGVTIGDQLGASIPTLSGTPTVGQTLTADAGAWGPAGVALTYQWKRNGVVIAGKTADTLGLVAADAGKTITVTVTGALASYTTTSRTSAAVTVGSALTATPTPVIVGTPASLQKLTATIGTWGPAPVALAYQWLRDGSAITGATATSYSLTSADAGTTITLRVTGSKAGFTTVVRESAGLAISDAFATAPTPTISGVPTVGEELTAVAGAWSPDPDLGYQWSRAGVAIAGATDAAYTLQAADAGKALTVTVTGSKSGYLTTARTSAQLVIGAALTSTPAPTVSGSLLVGSTLTAVPGAWAPAPVTFTYQWLRDGAPVAGRTAATYVLTNADAGHVLTVTVRGAKAGYTAVARTSADTAMVGGGTLTGVIPTISGLTTVDSVLTAKPGAWAPAPVELAYQWKRDSVDIPGATASTYTVSIDDLGKKLTVVVTGTKAGHNALTRVSAATAPIGI